MLITCLNRTFQEIAVIRYECLVTKLRAAFDMLLRYSDIFIVCCDNGILLQVWNIFYLTYEIKE